MDEDLKYSLYFVIAVLLLVILLLSLGIYCQNLIIKDLTNFKKLAEKLFRD
jgi:hypothetical protein